MADVTRSDLAARAGVWASLTRRPPVRVAGSPMMSAGVSCCNATAIARSTVSVVLLATQISRIEGKVDAVSLKMAEMPDVFQRGIQASTDKLTALIGRQTGSSPLSPAPAQGSPVVGNSTSDQRSGSSPPNLSPSNSGDPRIQR